MDLGDDDLIGEWCSLEGFDANVFYPDIDHACNFSSRDRASYRRLIELVMVLQTPRTSLTADRQKKGIFVATFVVGFSSFFMVVIFFMIFIGSHVIFSS